MQARIILHLYNVTDGGVKLNFNAASRRGTYLILYVFLGPDPHSSSENLLLSNLLNRQIIYFFLDLDQYNFRTDSYRLSPYAIPLMNTLQMCIIYYTVAVSVDRCLYVSMGLSANRYCTVRNALRAILGLTIFAIIVIIPHWLKFCAVKNVDGKNRTYYKLSCKYQA